MSKLLIKIGLKFKINNNMCQNKVQIDKKEQVKYINIYIDKPTR
jgi:hypothetical protein